MTARQKNIALIIGGIALLAALCAIVVLLLAQDDPATDSAADPISEQVALAAAEVELVRKVSALVERTDAPPGRYEGVGVDADGLRARANAGDGDRVVAQALAGGARSIAAASGTLAQIAAQAGEASDALVSEQVASAEASGQASALAEEVGSLSTDLDEARRDLKRSLLQVRSAVDAITASLEDEGQLESEAAGTLAAADGRIRRLARGIDESFESPEARLEELSGDLAERSVELEPDVVLDCPEIVPDGAGVGGVSVRNMSCAEAAALLGEFGPPGGFACTETGSGYESTSYRCTSGERALRYTIGA